jgi:hypothetical protein
MKNSNPAGKRMRFASVGERLMASLVFAVIAALIYVAMSGRYDREVDRVAHWMKSHWEALVH